MACEDLQKQFNAAVQKSLDLQKQLQDPTLKDPQEIASLKKALNLAGAAQFNALQQLDACKIQNGLLPRTPGAPARILETDYINPKFNPTSKDWNLTFLKTATLSVAGHSFTVKGFPYFGMEWTQVLEPAGEYDSPATMVAASGWVVNRSFAGGDFPFDHPWGDQPGEFDFEFQLGTDKRYQGLLGPGNKGNPDPSSGSDLYGEFVNEQLAGAMKLAPADGSIDTSKGLLGIEWEKHNIPQSFLDNVNNGDRCVVAGRWIVDCGHSIARTEIHPPLLLACASAPDPDTTKVLFTSRPYLVGQTYTTDFGSIYVDGKNDDGVFIKHMYNELSKANDTILGIPLESVHIEAHPKIKSRPFMGNPQVRFIIRPSSTHSSKPLDVSFQFTVRSGVTVQVTHPQPDRVDVLITMNAAAYKPPPLPGCNHKRNYDQAELDRYNSAAGDAFLAGEIVSPLIQLLSLGGPIGAVVVDEIISQGVYTDHYVSLSDRVNVLDSAHQATNTFGSASAGLVHDDTQPFPVFGWIEVKWGAPPPPPPAITIAPTTLVFASIPVKDVDTKSLVITNIGSVNATVTIPPTLKPATSAFSWDAGSHVIAPGAKLTVDFDFSPKGIGAAQSGLSIDSNATGSPFQITLKGTGIKGVAR